MELDLAADALEPLATAAGSAASNDLDDELLSLLDDQPRHSHSHQHQHSHSHSHTHVNKSTHASHSSAFTSTSAISKDAPAKKATATPTPRPSSATPAPSERVVMPPPIAPPNQTAKPVSTKTPVGEQQLTTKADKAESASASSSMKRKEQSAKPAVKPKQPAKSKAKAAATKSKAKAAAKDNAAGSSDRLTPSGSGSVAKGKKTNVSSSAAASAAKRSVSAAVGQSRSRSASVMPAPPEPASKPQEEEEEEEEEAADDKLYCICKTSYDEDKVMIACDRCDEWYHTQCLNMNDLEVDLIDQFVCPPCIRANPYLPLKTTYKQRCYAGLKHPRPSSAAACHKPARGAFSKFCSDECGIAYMQRRIDGWGGDQAVLWASVKDVKQREGVVVKVHVVKEEPSGAVKSEQLPQGPLCQLVKETHEVQQPTKTQAERAVARLQATLDRIAPKREALKKELEIVLWRQKLLDLAAARAEQVEECGWDQRLCLDDDEYAEYATSIMESYEEGHGQADGEEDGMQVDGSGIEHDAWWCRGKKKCQRHAGWQKLRAMEFEFDQELKEKAMATLTTQEREIRKQLEDAIALSARQASLPQASVPLHPLNGRTQTNGTGRSKANGTKKGKQKR
ncbi:hypothetical protein C8Q73DRAFT_744400 [Cubamyces lactineus]|nr:hypothetical protein C8Q73DRAFT_744400 [Cubamyces lactineus]